MTDPAPVKVAADELAAATAKAVRLARKVVLRKGDWSIDHENLALVMAEYDRRRMLLDREYQQGYTDGYLCGSGDRDETLAVEAAGALVEHRGKAPAIPLDALKAIAQGEPLDEVAGDYRVPLDIVAAAAPYAGRQVGLDPGPGPADTPEAIAERGLNAAQCLTRLVELKYGNALVPGWLDRWHDAWVEAHKLVGGDR